MISYVLNFVDFHRYNFKFSNHCSILFLEHKVISSMIYISTILIGSAQQGQQSSLSNQSSVHALSDGMIAWLILNCQRRIGLELDRFVKFDFSFLIRFMKKNETNWTFPRFLMFLTSLIVTNTVFKFSNHCSIF